MLLPLDPPWVIRDFRDDDAADLVRQADNPDVAIHLRDRFPNPYTEADAVRWLHHLSQLDSPTHWAIAEHDDLIGAVGLVQMGDVYARTAEIGYWLGEAHWGRGIATLAVGAITAYGFDALGLLRIEAAVFSNNPGSARVLEKCGYQFEGRHRQRVVKRGEVYDELMYARLRDES